MWDEYWVSLRFKTYRSKVKETDTVMSEDVERRLKKNLSTTYGSTHSKILVRMM